MRCNGAALDCFLQVLGGAESDLLAGLDLDRLAGRGVAAHARWALAHLQHAEPADADAGTTLQVLRQRLDHILEHRQDLLLRQLMRLRERLGDLAQSDGLDLGWRGGGRGVCGHRRIPLLVTGSRLAYVGRREYKPFAPNRTTFQRQSPGSGQVPVTANARDESAKARPPDRQIVLPEHATAGSWSVYRVLGYNRPCCRRDALSPA